MNPYVMNLFAIIQHKANKFWLKTLAVHNARSAEVERRKVGQAMADAKWFFDHKQTIKADNARLAARQAAMQASHFEIKALRLRNELERL